MLCAWSCSMITLSHLLVRDRTDHGLTSWKESWHQSSQTSSCLALIASLGGGRSVPDCPHHLWSHRSTVRAGERGEKERGKKGEGKEKKRWRREEKEGKRKGRTTKSMVFMVTISLLGLVPAGEVWGTNSPWCQGHKNPPPPLAWLSWGWTPVASYQCTHTSPAHQWWTLQLPCYSSRQAGSQEINSDDSGTCVCMWYS